ncbi:hypothetical protein FE783_36505 [Paenibacillus mesophilus]|uniref:hypothetical protein n=1 Tax=Paenibacillus mesophilus TaxID=2582849 RepID=UPI00110D855E|nr:hypothetical protein [Paenibacillus mesophilus]TMV43019.1 hypothetical protein FE783_36505 [Paenibacillus mesophilus]
MFRQSFLIVQMFNAAMREDHVPASNLIYALMGAHVTAQRKLELFILFLHRSACEAGKQKGQREELLYNECDSDVIGNKYDKYGIEVIRDGLHMK